MDYTKSYLLGAVDILTFIKTLHKNEKIYTNALDMAIELLEKESENLNEEKLIK